MPASTGSARTVWCVGAMAHQPLTGYVTRSTSTPFALSLSKGLVTHAGFDRLSPNGLVCWCDGPSTTHWLRHTFNQHPVRPELVEGSGDACRLRQAQPERFGVLVRWPIDHSLATSHVQPTPRSP